MTSKQLKQKIIIFACNDVYKFDNFPKLKALVDNEIKKNNIPIVTMAGDFLSPYLMSNIDKGYSMVQIMNMIPFDYVSLGNHEFDTIIPVESLTKRISESSAIWINTNIDNNNLNNLNKLVKYHIRTIITSNKNINIAFLGLCTPETNTLNHMDSTYNFINVIESAKQTISDIKTNHKIDLFIGLTHQYGYEDIELIDTIDEIDIILGGHEHDKFIYKKNNKIIMRSSQNMDELGIIDISFDNNNLIVDNKFICLNDDTIEGNLSVREYVDSRNTILNEFDNISLFSLDTIVEFDTSDIRNNQKSGAQLMLNILKTETKSDICIFHSGGIRSNTTKEDYKRGDKYVFTYKDLKIMFPFDHHIIKLQCVGEDINYLIKSNDKYKNTGMYLQMLDGIEINDNNTYNLCIPVYLLESDEYVEIFKKYVAGTKINYDDLLRTTTIILNYFMKQKWGILGKFEDIDSDNDGVITKDEIIKRLLQLDVPNNKSDLEIDMMINLCDKNNDKQITKEEFTKHFQYNQ